MNRKKEITAIVDTGLSKKRLAKKSPVVKRKLGTSKLHHITSVLRQN